MIDFHLFRKVFFQPFILVYIVVDELDSQHTVNLNGCLTSLAVVEPCLCPPSYSALVWIDTHKPWYIEALYVNLQFCKRIDESATGYCSVFGFFFSSADIVLRKT